MKKLDWALLALKAGWEVVEKFLAGKTSDAALRAVLSKPLATELIAAKQNEIARQKLGG